MEIGKTGVRQLWTKHLQATLVVILTYGIIHYKKYLLFIISPHPDSYYYYSQSINLVLVLAATGLISGYRPSTLLSGLGMDRSFGKGIFYALIMTLPMFAGAFLLSPINSTLTFEILLQNVFLAAFLEEIIFRGFVFGQLFRKAGWGFVPAAVLSGAIFGMGHLYQSSSMLSGLITFLVTFVGAVWFAWLFIEWENNLFIPIFLHLFMNLSWTLFDVDGSGAAGGLYSNIFRTLTIALSVILTIWYAKRRGEFRVRKNVLF